MTLFLHEPVEALWRERADSVGGDAGSAPVFAGKPKNLALWDRDLPAMLPALRTLARLSGGRFKFQAIDGFNIATNLPYRRGDALFEAKDFGRGLKIVHSRATGDIGLQQGRTPWQKIDCATLDALFVSMIERLQPHDAARPQRHAPPSSLAAPGC